MIRFQGGNREAFKTDLAAQLETFMNDCHDENGRFCAGAPEQGDETGSAKHGPVPIEIDMEKAKKMYNDEGKNLKEIANHLGISAQTLGRRFSNEGIDVRGSTSPNHGTPIIEGNIAKIPLSNGQHAVVDKRDLSLVENHTWRLDQKGYPVTRVGDNPKVRMHVVLGVKSPDHLDRDKLNNRRSNLDPEASRNQQERNKDLNSRNKSGYKGVFTLGDKHRASINYGGKTEHLGNYDTKEQAALAWNKVDEALNGTNWYRNEVGPEHSLSLEQSTKLNQKIEQIRTRSR